MAEITPRRPFPLLGALRFSTRVDALPLVLAGPILRAVTEDAVTVWLALKAAAQVTLKVYEGADQNEPLPLFQATATTIEVGTRLHVIALTATGAPLDPGALHSYNITVQTTSSTPTISGDLFTGGIVVSGTGTDLPAAREALCYGSFLRPTFWTPPASIATFRFAHGSCRQPHAESHDALSVLDDVLRINATVLENRPQQLFLTGDQIYADDVAQIMCAFAADAAPILIGDDNELIPGLGAGGAGRAVRDFGPVTREPICQAAGLKGSIQNRLVSFGEFAAHYLFVWNDAIWPQNLPTFEQLFPGMDPEQDRWALTTYQAEFIQLVKFRVRLHKVRRALANIPTYMIGDDHDVTDDFLLNREFCNEVLPSPTGRRILFNGLLSMAFFQAWGNTGPTAGGSSSFDARVGELITAYRAWRAAHYPPSDSDPLVAKLYDLVGLPAEIQAVPDIDDPAFVKIGRGTLRAPNAQSLPLYFQVGWRAHELVALSTRVDRGFPQRGVQNVALIHDDAIPVQIPNNTQGDNRVTIVLAAKPPREHPITTYYMEGELNKDKAFGRDVEGWAADPSAFERLFSALAARGSRNRKVIVLSGDVHYGYAVRHQYWSDRPLVDPQQGAAATFALFTSSALQKQTTRWKGSVMLHKLGFATFFFRPFDKRETTRLTWNRVVTTPLNVGHVLVEGPEIMTPSGTRQVPLMADPGRGIAVIDNLSRKAMEAGRGDADETKVVITMPPDAIARSSFISSTTPPEELPDALDTVDIDPTNQLLTSATYGANAVVGVYDKFFSSGREIIGVNNLGIVSFSVNSTTSDVTALQELWWFGRDDNENLVVKPFSKFPVVLTIEPKPAV